MEKKEKRSKGKKKPWPTKDAMEQVYAKNLWGGSTVDFYSGEGSHHPEIVSPYKSALIAFLSSFKNPLVVCDLGCGDFNVGKELVPYTKKYIAVDIVGPLISHSKEKFQSVNLEFHCLDIAKDALPSGDCAIVRQVLQHLSNAEIQSVLNKLSVYEYVIITEHVPEGTFEPNVDIISGQGTRLKKQSGVNVLEPPFLFKVKEEKQLVTVRLNEGQGVIVTTMYKVF